jgi:protein arginine N-methyltransferase 1
MQKTMTSVPKTPGYEIEQVWLPCSEGITSWDGDFHHLLLNDRLRMEAYGTGIAEAVKPGAVVLDLGTGTGILALWALQAGASRVYGLDLSAAILKEAMARISAAGFHDRFVPINALSFDVELPEKVDLIISEIMGNIGDNEDFVRILADARQRFLKPGGAMLPYRVETYLVPVEAKKAHEQLQQGVCQGLAPAMTLGDTLRQRGIHSPFDFYYDTIVPRSGYLATPRLARLFHLDGSDAPVYRFDTTFTVSRDGLFTGFKGYFIASLSPSVALDISGDDIPGGTASDSWKHCYLPIRQPIELKQSDRVTLSFSRTYPSMKDTPFRQIYEWHGEVRRGRDVLATFSQSTDRHSFV